MKKFLRAFCNFSYWQSRCHVLVIIACLSLAVVGQMPDSSGGWALALPTSIVVARKKKPTKGDRRRRARQKYRNAQEEAARQAIVTHHAKTTWLVPTLRTLTLAASFFPQGDTKRSVS
ncbi:MAG: hypothetical protein ACPGWR_03530 [Ardenticatenaceae bacterium]